MPGISRLFCALIGLRLFCLIRPAERDPCECCALTYVVRYRWAVGLAGRKYKYTFQSRDLHNADLSTLQLVFFISIPAADALRSWPKSI
jgi:hypothetical protein